MEHTLLNSPEDIYTAETLQAIRTALGRIASQEFPSDEMIMPAQPKETLPKHVHILPSNTPEQHDDVS